MIRKGDKVKFFNTGKEYDADEVGVLKMDMVPRNELRTGDVGYIISGIKTSKVFQQLPQVHPSDGQEDQRGHGAGICRHPV